MRKVGALKQISAVQAAVRARVRRETDQNSVYARALAYEGYAGGYLEALSDVSAVLRGTPVGSRYQELWEAAKKGTL